MNIALVVPGGVDRSGEYRVVPVLLAFIARLAREHDVSVFALHQEPRAASWWLYGARIINMGAPLPALRLVAAIRREHARAQFDVIHALWAGRGAVAANIAGRMLGVPVLVHLAGGELVALPDIGYGGRLHWNGRVAIDWALRGANAVTAASAPMIDLAARVGIRATRVPLGVDAATWPPLEPRPRTSGSAARLIHVASLNRVKDQTTLLQAIARLGATREDFHLDIVGEDVLNGQIQALAGRLCLAGRVTFHGFLTQQQLRPMMEAAHVNVVTSRHEAGPVVALEAALVGVPTVGTAVGHLCEWEPRATLTVPVGDVIALSAAIARVLDDDTLRLSMARAAAAVAIREDADYTAAAFMAQYARLAASQSR